MMSLDPIALLACFILILISGTKRNNFSFCLADTCNVVSIIVSALLGLIDN